MTAQKYQNLYYPHPGEILKTEFLGELGVTQYRLAVDTKIPHSRVTAIVRGRRSVSVDTALRLARYFGNSPEFWLGQQQDYTCELTGGGAFGGGRGDTLWVQTKRKV